jgi:hypothetical protein
MLLITALDHGSIPVRCLSGSNGRVQAASSSEFASLMRRRGTVLR